MYWMLWTAGRLAEVVVSAILLVAWSRAWPYPEPWGGFTPSLDRALAFVTIFTIFSGYFLTSLVLVLWLRPSRQLILNVILLPLFIVHYLIFSFLMHFALDSTLVMLVIGFASVLLGSFIAFTCASGLKN